MSTPNRQADYIWTCVLTLPSGGKIDLGEAQEKSGGGVTRESTAHRPAGTRKLIRIRGLTVPETIELQYSHTGQDLAQLRKAVVATAVCQEVDVDKNPIRSPDSFVCSVDGVGEPETNVDGADVAMFTITLAPNEQ